MNKKKYIRKFDGKNYRLQLRDVAQKNRAIREAKSVRKKGGFARITKTIDGYDLWVRN